MVDDECGELDALVKDTYGMHTNYKVNVNPFVLSFLDRF